MSAVRESRGRRTAVVGCLWEKDERIHWRWRGVYEWDMVEPLPKFVYTKDVLLV